MENKDIDFLQIAEYENFLNETSIETKSINPISDIMGAGESGSGLWEPELKAFMDLWTLKSLYYSEDWVYILVDRIASKIASLPLMVVKETIKDGKMTKEPAADHPFQRRIDNPNMHESYYQWMYSIVADHSIVGNSIIWDAKNTEQLIKIPAELVQLYFDNKSRDLLQYHVYRYSMEDIALTTDKMAFSPDEIIHIRRPNPSSVFWGLSPFIPGKKSVLFNRYSSEYLNNFYVKGAQPGLILEMQDDAQEKTVLRMLRSFELSHTGRKNQRRTLILPKGVKHNTVEHRIADQNIKEIFLMNRETIINLLQVPKHELSIAESGSLGSEEYKTALKNFWGGPLKAIMAAIEWSFFTHFKDQLGKGYSFQFDTSTVEVLRDDEINKASLAEKMLKTHTLNEVRQKLYNDKPLPGGDALPGPAPAMGGFGQFALPAPTPQLPAATEPEVTAAPVVTEEPVIEEVQAQPEIDKQLILTRNMERINQVKADNPQWWERRESLGQEELTQREPQMVNMVMELLSDQAVAAVKEVRSQVKEKAAEVPSKARLMKAIKDALNKFETVWLDNYSQALETTVDIGYDMSLELPFNMPNQSEIAALRAMNQNKRRSILEERGLETFANMTKTTTEKIMREVTAGVDNNLTVQDIAKNIMEVMTDKDFTIGRAMTIARTEVLTASSVGQAAAMRDAAEVVPNLKKMWLNAGDDRVRGNPGGLYAKSKADHWTLQGEVRKWDQNFSNGLSLPRDTAGGPGETINCRCTIVMVPGDDADKLGLEELTSDIE